MSEQTQKIEAASKAMTEAVQALADATGEHVELAVGMFGVVYYKYFHPPTCAEHDKAAPADVPDAFKHLWEDGGTTDEPKAE